MTVAQLTEKMLSLSFNPNPHQGIHNSEPSDSVLSLMNPDHTITVC
jgi:hypothetical protein